MKTRFRTRSILLAASLASAAAAWANPCPPDSPPPARKALETAVTVGDDTIDAGGCVIDAKGSIDLVGHLVINTTLTTIGPLSVHGGVITNNGFLAGGGTFTIDAAGAFSNFGGYGAAGPLTSAGTIDNVGSFAQGFGAFSSTGVIRNEAQGFFALGGTPFTNAGKFFNDGNLGVTGTADHPSEFTNTGTLASSASGKFSLSLVSTLNNRGTITNAGAWINFDSAVINDKASGRIETSGQFDNESMVHVEAVSEFENTGSFLNAGLFDNAGHFANNGTGTASNTGHFDNSGSLDNALKAAFGNTGVFDNSGTVDNLGSFGNSGSGVATNRTNGLVMNSGRLDNQASFVTEAASVLKNSGSLGNSGTLSNHGTIDNGAGGSFDNSGIVLNQANGLIRNLGGVFTNSGSITNAAVLSNSGTMANTGTIDSSGLLGSGSGTLSNQAGGRIANTGSIQIGTALALPSAPVATVDNGGKIDNKASGTIEIFAAGRLDNSGTITNSAVARIDVDKGATFTNSASLVNDGAFGNAGTVLVSGQITGSGTYTQTGGLTKLKGGTITQSLIDVQGGQLLGAGGLSGAVHVGPGATLGPGDPNVMTISGPLTLDGGTLLFQIAGKGAGQFDVLKLDGALALHGGTIAFDFLNGYAPSAKDSFNDFLSASGGISGLASLKYEFLDVDPALRFSVDSADGKDLSLVVLAAPVPEPAGWVLWAVGLPVMLRLARRRFAPLRKDSPRC